MKMEDTDLSVLIKVSVTMDKRKKNSLIHKMSIVKLTETLNILNKLL